MTVSRVVALLTPIFAALAGALAAWVADNVPGAPRLDSTELTAVFIVIALTAAQAAATWLKGRGLWEASAVKDERGVAEPLTLLVYVLVFVILIVVLFEVLDRV
jgi:hypothetical protein